MGDKKTSKYDGYVPMRDDGVVIGRGTRKEKARGAKQGFDNDQEGMRTAYETMRKKDDPTADKMSKMLGSADEDAASLMQDRHRDFDTMNIRENRNMKSAAEANKKFAKGGAVKKSSTKIRGAGIAQKGVRKAKMC